MSTLSTTSALGLDLGSMTLPTHPSTLSANGSFAVESYTPTQGCAGDILTVTLAFFESTLPINHQDQAYDFRLIVNDKKLRSKVEHDSDGKLVIRALLSTSLASLSGLVLMGLHIYRDNILFDYCNFGRFNLARMPMSSSAPSTARTSSKREGDGTIPTPFLVPKKSKFLPAPPVSTCDSQQAKLIIETDIAKLGDLSTWSPAEINERRRFVRLTRQQQGPNIHLRTVAVSAEEVSRDDRNVINCMLPPGRSEESCVSSVDIIKAIELLVNPRDRRLSIEEKNRIRRNLDTLRPTTLKKGGESLNWIMQLRSPRPIIIAKDVKIFKWDSLEAALVKIMKRYSIYDDGSLVEQRTSARSDEPASARSTSARLQANEAEPNGVELQTPPPVLVPACAAANSETALVNLTIPELPPTTCDSPTSLSLSLLSTPSSVEVSFNVLPPQQDDAAILDMIAYLVDQNFTEQPATPFSSTFAASPTSFKSTLLSDSGSSLDDELYTPVTGNVGELFNVEGGCGTSPCGSEYLGHAELGAPFDGSPIQDVNSDSSPLVKLCNPLAKDLGALFNYPLLADDFNSIVDSSNWNINQTTSSFASQGSFSDRFLY